MNKFTKLSLCAFASLSLFPAVAMAGTFTPPSSTATSVGTVTVQKGISLSCRLTATISSDGTISSSGPPSGTKITALSLSPGNILCGTISFVGLPYDVSATSATGIIIHDVRVNGITGNCRGDLAASVSGGVITFSASNTIPSDPPGGSPCSIAGTANTSPSVSFTYP